MTTPTPAERGADERAAVVAWLKGDVATEALRMTLAARMPGGTKTERVKAAAFADGCLHAVGMIKDAVIRGDHHRKAEPHDD